MTTKPRTVVLHKRPDYHSFGIYVGEDVPVGIYIVTIEPNSPAVVANIQPGDRILAVNGQLVSSMLTNPKDMLVQTAANAQSLTLTIQSTNILEAVNLISPNNSNYQYTSKQNNDIDHELERYIKKLFGDENLRITPLENTNEYMLTFNEYPLLPHRRKRRYHRKNKIKKIIDNEQKENNQPVFRNRPIPSMGTPHVILRNSQLPSKDNTVNGQQEVKPLSYVQSTVINNPDFNTDAVVDSNSQPISPPIQPFNELTNNRMNPNRSSSINGDGLHEVHLSRSSDFQGYGFHLQYNKVYYVIIRVESNSPAERAGIRVNDVIRKANDQSTEQMLHEDFVQLVNSSTEVVFLVQPFDDYYRANPHVPMIADNNNNNNITVINNNNDAEKRQSMLSKAFTKFKTR